MYGRPSSIIAALMFECLNSTAWGVRLTVSFFCSARRCSAFE
jgi:hypothetical protein